MAYEVAKDLSFFAGVMNNTILDGSERTRKALSKPKSPNINKRKTQSLSKENTPKKVPIKESRMSKKNERVPLKVLNAKVKSPKKSVSPKSEKDTLPSKKKSTSKANLSAPQTKAPKKAKESLPKIIVYEDPPGEAKTQKKKDNKKSVKGLSKSLDGLVTKNRKSHPELKENPKLIASKTKSIRHSLNDLSKIKTPTKKGETSKTVVEVKKSPANRKSRLTKLKPGQPEFEKMITKLETLFPNVDPEYIKTQFLKFKGSLSEAIEFILTKEKTNELPSRINYLKKLEMERLQNAFLKNFSIVNFLKIFPDPWKHFLEREKHNCANYLGHSLHYLKTKYKKLYLRAIQDALARNEYSLYLADKELKRKNRSLKMRATNRSKFECDAGRPTTFNMQFIHEVAFIENESKIKSHIKKAERVRNEKFKEAKEAGTLLECQSCNNFSLLQDDVVNCPANHVFCKDCVVRYVEAEVEKNNFNFKCLLKCEEKFSLETLQAILSSPVMGKIIKQNQLEEIKSAGINDLVGCPFCYYVLIMPPELSVFKCQNPGCMMESCRHCKKLNHLPLKCNELENFDSRTAETKNDIQKQEKDPILQCTKCNEEFLKREDSNQMVCRCGATICSVCRQPFRECEHFNANRQSESPLSLSNCSNDTEIDEDVPEDDVERSSNCSENFNEMFLSESENF